MVGQYVTGHSEGNTLTHYLEDDTDRRERFRILAQFEVSGRDMS